MLEVKIKLGLKLQPNKSNAITTIHILMLLQQCPDPLLAVFPLPVTQTWQAFSFTCRLFEFQNGKSLTMHIIDLVLIIYTVMTLSFLGKQCRPRRSLIRVYTVCPSICIIWIHYSMVEPHSSNFIVITTNVLGSEYLGNLRYTGLISFVAAHQRRAPGDCHCWNIKCYWATLLLTLKLTSENAFFWTIMVKYFPANIKPLICLL